MRKTTTTKTYKTLGCAIRHYDDRLCALKARAKLKGEPFNWTEACRPVLPGLLRGLGINATFEPNDNLADCLKRIKAMSEYQENAKDIDKLIAFVKGPRFEVISATVTSVTTTDPAARSQSA